MTGKEACRQRETSLVNAQAVRGSSGIWNEETLPVTEWEIPEHRVVLSQDLQRSLNLETPVLRMSEVKYRRIHDSRPQDRHILRELSRYLSNWDCHGNEAGRPGNHRVMLQDERRRWYAVSIGPDKNRSYNVVTVIGGSDAGFLQNRLNEMRNVVRRER